MKEVRMHKDPPASGSIAPWQRASTDRGPTEGNHRLTALTGSLLTPLLAAIFLTGLLMDALWHVHYVVGFVLIPVVALKLSSTGYRALRYYTRNPTYLAAGPPELLPRLIAPFLALSVVTALVTGVALFVQHSRGGTLSTLHTDASVCSAALIGLHALTYVADALATTLRELRSRPWHPASTRLALVAAALLLGVLLAAATYGAGVWPQRPRDQREGSGFSSQVPGAVVRRAELDPSPRLCALDAQPGEPCGNLS